MSRSSYNRSLILVGSAAAAVTVGAAAYYFYKRCSSNQEEGRSDGECDAHPKDTREEQPSSVKVEKNVVEQEAKVVVVDEEEEEEKVMEPEDDDTENNFVEYLSPVNDDENVVDYSSPMKAHVLVSGHPIHQKSSTDAPSVAPTEASVMTEDDDDIVSSIMSTPPRASSSSAPSAGNQKPSWFNPISEVDELESDADVFVHRILFG